MLHVPVLVGVSGLIACLYSLEVHKFSWQWLKFDILGVLNLTCWHDNSILSLKFYMSYGFLTWPGSSSFLLDYPTLWERGGGSESTLKVKKFQQLHL